MIGSYCVYALKNSKGAALYRRLLNPSVWTSDVLYDLERWERHVQAKQN